MNTKQKLFKYLSEEHNITLLDSELQKIINICIEPEEDVISEAQRKQMDLINLSTNKIVKSIITTQILENDLHCIKQTKYYKQDLKKYINLLRPILIKNEKEHFDLLYNKSDNATSDVYDIYNYFLNKVSEISIPEATNYTYLINAYQLDPKSMQGIVNKILK